MRTFSHNLRLAAALLLVVTAAARAQDRYIGVILEVDAAAGRLRMRPDAGGEASLRLAPATRFLQVAPGAKDLTGATPLRLADLSAGDRILARGRPDGDAFAAELIVVMSKAALANKQAAERADWERRGIGGVITALDPASRQLTLRNAAQSVTVMVPPAAVLRRYAPDSLHFRDARICRFEDLRPGDQVKARGAADGSRFTAEELVAGAFRTIGALVNSLDLANRVLEVTDLATKTRIQVQIRPDSSVRRLTPQLVQLLQQRIAGNGSPGDKDAQALVDGLPAADLASLKPGDAVVVASTAGADPSQVTAITLLAGVEPLFQRAKGGKAPDIGSWNLDLSMNVSQ